MFSSCRLYSCIRLTCTSNSELGSMTMLVSFFVRCASASLFRLLTRIEAIEQAGVIDESFELPQVVEIANPTVADRARDQRRQRTVRVQQPAARRDAVRLVVEALGIELVKLRSQRRLHELRVQRGHAVDRMAAGHRQVAHPHVAALAFVEKRNALQHAPRRPESAARPRPADAD